METKNTKVQKKMEEYECLWHTYGIRGETIIDCNTWHDYSEQEEKNWFRVESTKRIKGTK